MDPPGTMTSSGKNQQSSSTTTKKKSTSSVRQSSSSTIRFHYLLYLLLLLLLKQVRRPFEKYAGVEVNFKTPNVLRVPEEELARWEELQRQQASFRDKDEDIPSESTDSSEDASHDIPLQGLQSPAHQVLQNYQRLRSVHQLEDELEDCRERANVKEDESIVEAVQEGWCPELAQHQFLVVQVNCTSPESLIGSLNEIATAIILSRTLLWKESPTCQGLLKKADWMAEYYFWKDQLQFGSAKTVKDLSIIDNAEEAPRVMKLSNGATNGHALESFLKQDTSRAVLEQLIFDPTFSDGMLLYEALEWDDSILQILQGRSYHSSQHYYAIQASPVSTPKPECLPSFLKHPCTVYPIGSKSISHMLLETNCQIAEDQQGGSHFLKNLVHASWAKDGVVLEERTAFGKLLTEFIRYQYKMIDQRYELEECYFPPIPKISKVETDASKEMSSGHSHTSKKKASTTSHHHQKTSTTRTTGSHHHRTSSGTTRHRHHSSDDT